jgi:hypothetical protein
MTDQQESTGPGAADLSNDDLLRELEQLHRTRHETSLHGSESALTHHTQRTAELEREYRLRNPQRDVDDERLRAGRRDNT